MARCTYGGISAFLAGVLSAVAMHHLVFAAQLVGTRWGPLKAYTVLMRGLLQGTGTVHDDACRSAQSPGDTNASHFDALLIAGGGQTPSGPPNHVVLRLQKAVDMFFAQDPHPIIVTSGRGTPHKPNPHDASGFAINEASMNARWLMEHGVPPHMILEENSSMETVGNAFFARVLHADVLGLQRIAVINNGWHMQRTRDVYSHVFAVPSRDPCAARAFNLTFVQVASGLDSDVERLRLAKETATIPKFAPGGPWQRETPTLEALHLWLHRENLAYAARRLLQAPSQPIDHALAKSY